MQGITSAKIDPSLGNATSIQQENPSAGSNVSSMRLSTAETYQGDSSSRATDEVLPIESAIAAEIQKSDLLTRDTRETRELESVTVGSGLPGQP